MSDQQHAATPPRERARYIMIGGFLGAGKSTSVGRFARYLTDRGSTVGLITNDQAAGLVDTQNLRSQGFDVEEIAGGCFCCRFDSLRGAAEKLDATTRPDVFLAEPVGSCTDLVATVSYPLRRIYGDRFSIAPLSVLVDPARAMRILGLSQGRSFSRKVSYVYLKQLEEAQALVINKVDTLDDIARHELRRALGERFPNRPIFELSAREGEGLEPWFEHLLAHEIQVAGPGLEIDYQLYGEGEALLGWLNATLELRSPEPLDGNALIRDLAVSLGERLRTADAEVAHLKMTLAPRGGWGDLALVSLVRSDVVPELSERLHSPAGDAQLVLNLRAEGDPELLHDAVRAELAALELPSGAELRLEHLEHFRPAQPQPTHRIVAGDAG